MDFNRGGRQLLVINKLIIVLDRKTKDLLDYKFYCFNGIPKYLYVSQGLDNHETATISFVTMDWKFAPFGRSDFLPMDQLPEKPKHFSEMIDIAKTLSAEHPFLRVDLYEIDNHVYFSELTFTPSSGFMPFSPNEYDLKLGRMLKLPQDR